MKKTLLVLCLALFVSVSTLVSLAGEGHMEFPGGCPQGQTCSTPTPTPTPCPEDAPLDCQEGSRLGQNNSKSAVSDSFWMSIARFFGLS